MKVIAIIQARMGSRRLPKKTLMQISGVSLLEIVINSVKQNSFITKIIVATSEKEIDDIIENECQKLQVDCFRGHPENVLSRYMKVAQQLESTHTIVRVTADNPVNNTKATKKLFNLHQKNEADYTFVQGLSHTVYEFIKVESFLKLQSVDKLTAEEKEHVTVYFRTHPQDFKLQQVPSHKLGIDQEVDKLFTIDTQDDFERWREVSQHFDLSKSPGYNQLKNYFKASLNA